MILNRILSVCGDCTVFQILLLLQYFDQFSVICAKGFCCYRWFSVKLFFCMKSQILGLRFYSCEGLDCRLMSCNTLYQTV
jgi:hypothetical protein